MTINQHEPRSYKFVGIGLAIAASFAFATMIAIAQTVMSDGVTPMEVALCRMGLTVPILITYGLSTDPSSFRQLSIGQLPSIPFTAILWPSSWTEAYRNIPEADICGQLIWLRGVLSTIGINADYFALQFVSISENRTIYNLKPFPTAFLCWLVLGERFGWKIMVAAAISTLAVLAVAQPEFLVRAMYSFTESDTSVGVKIGGLLMSGVNMLTSAVNIVICRRIGTGGGPTMLTLAYASLTVMFTPLIILVSGQGFFRTFKAESILPVIGLTAASLVAQFCLVFALQRDKGAKIAVLEYLQIPMAGVLQIVCVGDSLNLIEALGMGVIIGAGVWIVASFWM